MTVDVIQVVSSRGRKGAMLSHTFLKVPSDSGYITQIVVFNINQWKVINAAFLTLFWKCCSSTLKGNSVTEVTSPPLAVVSAWWPVTNQSISYWPIPREGLATRLWAAVTGMSICCGFFLKIISVIWQCNTTPSSKRSVLHYYDKGAWVAQ